MERWLRIVAVVSAVGIGGRGEAWAQGGGNGDGDGKAGELDEPFEMPKVLGDPGMVEPPAEAEPAEPVFELDKLELRWGGRLQTDLRFQVEPKSAGLFYDREAGTFYRRDDIQTGVRRNENIFEFKLDAIYGRFAGVVDMNFVWLGYPEHVEGIEDLSLRQRVSAYYLEVQAAYLEAADLLVDGLDLRVGQQLVQWGKADQFNPTNNLNPNDLEDVILFGQQSANLMVRLDYQPPIDLDWLHSTSLSAVLVPIFEPALLPRSASLGLKLTDRLPFVWSSLRYRLEYEQAFAAAEKQLIAVRYPTLTTAVEPELPERSLENMQAAFRLAFTLGGQDLAFSYYRGFHDLPQPIRNHTTQLQQPFCNLDDPEDCVDGLLQTTATLGYPRIQVVGFNLAGEIPLDWIADSWGGLGYRLELGVYFPEQMRVRLTQDEVRLGFVTQPAGEYDYDADGEPGGPRPVVLEDAPFAKWTLGLDYSFGPHVLAVLMWVHGMADDFGAGDYFHKGYAVRQSGVVIPEGGDSDFEQCAIFETTTACGPRYGREILRPRIGDYLVFGLDLKWDDDRALLRLFTIFELTPYFEDFYDSQAQQRVRKYIKPEGENFSAALFPEFNYNFGNGLELGFGALVYLGPDWAKFGDPAAGGSFVWTRARYSY